MKPTLAMDEKSPSVVVMQQPSTDHESGSTKKSNKRLVIGVVSGITILLIVLAAVLAAVSLGAKVTKDSQKEAWLNYRDNNGEKKSEHVVANDREEDYTVPNQMRVIYDFEKGYAVYKFERSDDDDDNNDDYDVCYVSHLNRTALATPEQVKDELTGSEIDTPSNTESDEEKYESTGQMFDRDLLSPRAREMCKDSKVVWMAKANGVKKQKRACIRYLRCFYYYRYIGGRRYLFWRCYYITRCF